MTDQLTEIRKRFDEPRLSAWTWYPISQDDVRFLLRQLEAAESLAASRLGEIARLKADGLSLAGMWYAASTGGRTASITLSQQDAHEAASYERGKSDARQFCAESLEAQLRAVAAPLAPQNDEEKNDDTGLLGTTGMGKSDGPPSTSGRHRCGVCWDYTTDSITELVRHVDSHDEAQDDG